MSHFSLSSQAPAFEAQPALKYSATHVMLEGVSARHAGPMHAVSFNAAAWHAKQIVDHAVAVGDHVTAALMGESFARLAMHAKAKPRTELTATAYKRECSTFQLAAVHLLASAYPGGTDVSDLSSMDQLIANMAGAN